jgi:hypothetical protein
MLEMARKPDPGNVSRRARKGYRAARRASMPAATAPGQNELAAGIYVL